MYFMRKRAIAVFLAAACATALYAQAAPRSNTSSILDYIGQTWKVLTPSNKDLAKAAVDPKFHPAFTGRWPVYIPQNGDLHGIEAELLKQTTPAAFETIELRPPPTDLSQLHAQGLLY